jgi:hypothetical protein
LHRSRPQAIFGIAKYFSLFSSIWSRMDIRHCLS